MPPPGHQTQPGISGRAPGGTWQAGATVTVCDEAGCELTYQIVGIDEADAGKGMISWISPLAKALLKAREGDTVRFQIPDGLRELDVVGICYK